MPLPIHPFHAAAAEAVAAALGLDAGLFVVGQPPKPEMGDFAVGCFPAAKELRQGPPVLARQVAEQFEPSQMLESATAAGPFVNFRARRDTLLRHLFEATLAGMGELIPTSVGAGKTVCIDYSSPNIAKHLAYHHIRSTVIGHALALMYRALGYEVVGINHLGDWGTTHGMILAARDMWGAPEPLTIDALNDLYVRFRTAMKEDESLEKAGRAWFHRLEQGDSAARAAWLEGREVSLAEFQEVYDQLGIVFDEVKGESEYEEDMPGVIAMLEEKGLTSTSQGALVVNLEDADMPPLLLKKQDGATLYATRDLAAALYRYKSYSFARSLYVVDRGQGLHFKQLFTVLARAGYDWADRCAHIPFGLVRIGGKKTGTRTGNVVLLKEVLGEAESRMAPRIRERNPELTEEELRATARVVGTGAIIFANLSSQREKDVDFSWDDALSTDGDAGPYVQYAYARCSSILRKAAEQRDSEPVAEPITTIDLAALAHPTEWALAKKLLEVGDVLHRATDANEPHTFCRYLLDVAGALAQWYTAGKQDGSLRVLCADPAARRARIALTAATREVLRNGLALLGMGAPGVM